MPRRWIRTRYVPEVWDVEKTMRRVFDPGMFVGTVFTLRYLSDFELHGHYETWAQGWELVDERHGFRIRGEWLDEVLERATVLAAGDEAPKAWERWPVGAIS